MLFRSATHAGNAAIALEAGHHVGHVKAFLCLSIPVMGAVALAISGLHWIPHVQTKAQSKASDATKKSSFLDLLRDRTLRNVLIASGIVSSAWDVYQFFMPIYGRSLGMSATAIGLVVSAFAVSIIVIRLALPFFVRRLGETETLTYAMFVACAAFLMFPFFSSAWALAAVSFFLGVGCGVGQPLSMTLVYNASPKGREGEAAGMRITVNQIAHAAIPIAFGALGSLAGYAAVFVTNAAFLFGGGMLSQRLLRKPNG